MDVKKEHEKRVIVRGINDVWKADNFISLHIRFGGDPKAVPKYDAYYVGLYMNSPDSKIMFIGVVDRIERDFEKGTADFYLKTLMQLENPYVPGHPIRKHQYFKLGDFDLTEAEELALRSARVLFHGTRAAHPATI